MLEIVDLSLDEPNLEAIPFTKEGNDNADDGFYAAYLSHAPSESSDIEKV